MQIHSFINAIGRMEARRTVLSDSRIEYYDV